MTVAVTLIILAVVYEALRFALLHLIHRRKPAVAKRKPVAKVKAAAKRKPAVAKIAKRKR